MVLKADSQYDQHNPWLSAKIKPKGPALRPALLGGGASRIIVCLVLLVIILAAQQKSFPGAEPVCRAVNYTINTNYDLYPWLEKYRGSNFWSNLEPAASRNNSGLDFLNGRAGVEGPGAESSSGWSNPPDLSTLQPYPSFIYPVAAGKVVSRFDPQGKNPDTAFLSGGITIETNIQQKVLAGCAGLVTAVSGDGQYGYTVQIDHGQGIISITAGCSAVLAKPGDQVSPGQEIGRLLPANKAPNHLYFEIRVQGRPVDPLLFIQPDLANKA